MKEGGGWVKESRSKTGLRADGGANCCHQTNTWKRKRGQFNEEEEEDGQKNEMNKGD